MKHFRHWEGSTALVGMARSRYVRDAFQTFDQATIDSAGAFLVGELERLDPMIHLPLAAVTWQRDIDLRTDVTIGDEVSSYTLTSFGSAGGAVGNGINWAAKDTTTISRTTLDIGKIANPLNLVTYEVAYTIPELKSAELTGRPIDTQMLSGMQLKHQMDTDQVVYIGDPNVIVNATGQALTGLCNSVNVSNVATAAAAGASSPTGQTTSTKWADKTPAMILADVNALLLSVWAATGYAVAPTKLLIAPVEFGYISTTPVSVGGTSVTETILSYLKTRNILTAEKDIPLDIQSVKWLDKTVRGVATDRMVAYVQRPDFVRYPMVPLQAVQPQPRGIWIAVPYYGRLGVVETVYPETIGYVDGIG